MGRDSRIVGSPTVSNRYDELPPILLTKSAAPMPTTRAVEAVFRLVVDTHGRTESVTVETLAATNSTTARDVRRRFSGVRYASLQKDRAFARRLARCCARSPVALERLWYNGTAEQS